MRGVGVGIVVAGLSVGIALGINDRTRPPAPPAPASSIPSQIVVHVAGWVVSPGVVTVTGGSLVADAIAAAGGFRSGGRSDLINLAAPVQEGEQILVPGPDVANGGLETDGLIPLNRATAADLEALPGVGPVLAERIESFREANGPFGQVEDLLQVPGIGEAKLAAIRDLVRVP